MRDNVVVTVGAVIAVLLQVIVAPNIVVFFAMPNFLLVYVCAVSMVRSDNFLFGMAFILGLLFDLFGNNTVGIMAFLFVLVAFLVSRTFTLFDHEAFLVPLVMMIVVCLFVEVFYAFALMLFGLDISMLDALILRSLPCALYDAAVGLIMLPALFHFIKPADAHTGDYAAHTMVSFR